ncbi:MAG: amidohydrolase family protein, partial [Phycisphaerae bacterium]
MAAPVIIDAHVHFRSPGPALDQAELARTLRRADAVGIERLVLVGSIIAHGPNPTRRQVRATNEQTIRAVQQQPERFWGLCYVNPLHGRWARQELLRCVRDGPLCGLKLWVACRASDPAVRDLMQLAHELGVAVLQHAWNKAVPELPGESSAADVARLAEQLPDLRIQMAHMGGVGWRGINQVTPYRNILIDTGGAQPIAGLLEYALRRI